MDWDEFEDVRSHEIFTDFGGPAFLTRDARIRYTDQRYTVKAVRRFTRTVKSWVMARYENKRRDYHENFDSSPLFYPGVEGDYKFITQQFAAGCDVQIVQGCSTTFKYEAIDGRIRHDLAGRDTADLNVQRLSASVTASPVPALVIIATGALEDYHLRTPAAPVGPPTNDYNPDPSVYDVDGDYYTVLVHAIYAVSPTVSLYGSLQHTEPDGTTENQYDRTSAGVKYRPTEDQTVSFTYTYYRFDDISGNGFDDYKAHGAAVTYERTF
jgi:hypothetical protein